MDTLPTPLSRIELYLAKIAGVAVTIPEKPMSRLEMFLAVLAGDTSVAMPAPMSRTELWLAWIGGITPSPLPAVEGACYIGPQKVDVRYFARAAGMPGSPDIPEPQNRTEQYWYQIASNVPIVGFLKYATGIEMTLTDILSGIEDLQFVYGDTYQQTYSGKNLYEGSQDFSGTWQNDWGWTTDTNTYNGLVIKTRSDAWNGLYKEITVESGKTYTFSLYAKAESNRNAAIYTSGGSTTVTPSSSTVDVTTSWTRYSLTFTANGSGTVRPRIENTTSGITMYVCGYQIEESDSMTSYEPYVGGIPAPNPDYPQDVQVVTGRQLVTISGEDQSQEHEINLGKNLWGGFSADMTRSISGINFNNLANGDISISAGTTTAQANSLSSSQVAGTDRLLTLQAGTYSISGAIGAIRVQLINSTGGVIANDTGAGATVTLSSPTQAFVRVSIEKNEVVTDTTIHPQLELGTSPTPYAPYFTPIELCKIGDYQDYIYKSGENWYLHKEIGSEVLDGDEDWRIDQTGTQNFFYYTFLTINSANTSDSLRSNYGRGGDIRLTNTVNGMAIFNQKQLRIRYGQEMSIADWKSKLASNNMIVYTFLATPTDTQITDATLISQLDALDSAVLPKPNANITVTASDPNLPGAIKISYYTRHE